MFAEGPSSCISYLGRVQAGQESHEQEVEDAGGGLHAAPGAAGLLLLLLLFLFFLFFFSSSSSLLSLSFISHCRDPS
ncbi:Hypothetical predicted protein, partial [Podarcis lilfordi]